MISRHLVPDSKGMLKGYEAMSKGQKALEFFKIWSTLILKKEGGGSSSLGRLSANKEKKKKMEEIIELKTHNFPTFNILID